MVGVGKGAFGLDSGAMELPPKQEIDWIRDRLKRLREMLK